MDRFSSLRLFVRVIERGSFSHVGREMGIGQPAVSKQIAALESRLGVPLLNRTSRGLSPTAAGQAALARRHMGRTQRATDRPTSRQASGW